jgi:hypothetical protein
MTIMTADIVIVDLQGISEDRYDKYSGLVDYQVPLVRQLYSHGILPHDLDLAALCPAIEEGYSDNPAFERTVKRIRVPEVPGFPFAFLSYHRMIAFRIFLCKDESLLFTPSGAKLTSLPIALFNISNLLTFLQGIRLPRCHPVRNNGS